jgi:hypothetical protein
MCTSASQELIRSSIPANSRNPMIRTPRYSTSVSRSLSPVIRYSQWPAVAAASTRSSSGSRHAGLSSLGVPTDRVRSRTYPVIIAAWDGENLNFRTSLSRISVYNTSPATTVTRSRIRRHKARETPLQVTIANQMLLSSRIRTSWKHQDLVLIQSGTARESVERGQQCLIVRLRKDLPHHVGLLPRRQRSEAGNHFIGGHGGNDSHGHLVLKLPALHRSSSLPPSL